MNINRLINEKYKQINHIEQLLHKQITNKKKKEEQIKAKQKQIKQLETEINKLIDFKINNMNI